jgi:hypothetical protein
VSCSVHLAGGDVLLNIAQFEENNKSIAEIVKVQALVLLQDIGLWSGNRRKMEIAECRKTVQRVHAVPG